MSRHSQIFRLRRTAPIIVTNIPLDPSRRLPQTPRPDFPNLIHDCLESATPRSPSFTLDALGSIHQHSPPSSPVPVCAAFIEIGQAIAFCYVFCLIKGLGFFLWVATFGTVRFRYTENDESDYGHKAGASFVPSPVTRTHSSSSSTASEPSSVYSFYAPSSPGVAIALPQSLLDQILADGYSSPTASGLHDRSSIEGAYPSWGDSSTAFEPSIRARSDSPSPASSPSIPYSYSSSFRSPASVGGMALSSSHEDGIANALPPSPHNQIPADPTEAAIEPDAIPLRDPTDHSFAQAISRAQRHVEEWLSELEIQQRLGNGNGGSAPF